MNLHRNNAETRRGFNLIELLVIIAVLGLLAALLLPMMVTAKGKSMSISA